MLCLLAKLMWGRRMKSAVRELRHGGRRKWEHQSMPSTVGLAEKRTYPSAVGKRKLSGGVFTTQENSDFPSHFLGVVM